MRERFSSDVKKFDKDSIICYECLQKLGKLIKYEKEIQHIKQEIFDFLNKLGTNYSLHRQPCSSQTFPRAKKHKTVGTSTASTLQVPSSDEVHDAAEPSTDDNFTLDGVAGMSACSHW